MPSTVETAKIIYTLHEDDILEVRYREGQSVDSRSEARFIRDERIALQGEGKCKLLMDATVKVKMSGSAKRYLGKAESVEGISAIAMIVGEENITIIKQLMVYLLKRRLHVPIRIYHTREAALEWLRSL